MPWLKALHLCAVIVWSGALLYLPAVLAAAVGERAPPVAPAAAAALPRRLYVGVATPAALLAIGSGSALIFAFGAVPSWLVLKLAVVGVLVLAHGACGWLVLRAEHGVETSVTGRCALIGLVSIGCLAATAALVLRKPA